MQNVVRVDTKENAHPYEVHTTYFFVNFHIHYRPMNTPRFVNSKIIETVFSMEQYNLVKYKLLWCKIWQYNEKRKMSIVVVTMRISWNKTTQNNSSLKFIIGKILLPFMTIDFFSHRFGICTFFFGSHFQIYVKSDHNIKLETFLCVDVHDATWRQNPKENSPTSQIVQERKQII